MRPSSLDLRDPVCRSPEICHERDSMCKFSIVGLKTEGGIARNAASFQELGVVPG